MKEMLKILLPIAFQVLTTDLKFLFLFTVVTVTVFFAVAICGGETKGKKIRR